MYSVSLTSSHASVMRFCIRKGFFVNKKSEYTEYTHLSMDGYRGGLLSIPACEENEFYNCYAQDVANGLRLYLLESRTEYFPMFLDFDVKLGSRFITPDSRLVILRYIYQVIRLFYPKSTPSSYFGMVIQDTSKFNEGERMKATKQKAADITIDDLLSLGETKETQNEDKIILETSDDNPAWLNNNMHIVFPKLIVTQEQGYIMCHAIANKFTYGIDDSAGLGDWSTIFDKSVYLKNGLRTVGSRKCKPCICKGKGCSECDFIGKRDLGKVYYPVAFFTGVDYDKTVSDNIQRNYTHAIRICSIRRPLATASTVGWKKYDGCPGIDNSLLLRVKDSKKSNTPTQLFNKLIKNRNIQLESREDTIGQRKQRSLCIEFEKSSPFYQAVLVEIRRFHREYEHIGIRSLATNKNGSYFRACTFGDGSTVCLNLIKKEHNNNTIYFIIKPDGVYQKCWCSCDTVDGRRYGLCSKYMSAPKPLLTKNKNCLFPQHKQKSGSVFNAPISVSHESPDTMAIDRMIAAFYMRAFVDTSSKKRPPVSSRKKEKRKKLVQQ